MTKQGMLPIYSIQFLLYSLKVKSYLAYCAVLRSVKFHDVIIIIIIIIINIYIYIYIYMQPPPSGTYLFGCFVRCWIYTCI